jgi:7,8-dihydropterin-6-yl-methyl-4-(beta-D-ribofuranosyl)aminobenzene 5'-phosphate synthase
MKVTTLIENRPSEADKSLDAEWGLSLHVEFDGHRILFDTGTSGAFARNAERLSIRLEAVETAVLSHHHFDHGGGLRTFLEKNSSARVHLGEAPGGECFLRIFGIVRKCVGLDRALSADFPGRFVFVDRPMEILPDVYVFPRITGNHPRPAGNRSMYVKKGRSFEPDGFTHEIVMAVKEKGKLVIFTGCSHSGVLNAIDTVTRAFPGLPVKAVVGGFHLVSMLPFFSSGNARQAQEIARAMLDYPVETTYTGHCTGPKAFGVLQSVMGERLVDIRTGTCFEI